MPVPSAPLCCSNYLGRYLSRLAQSSALQPPPPLRVLCKRPPHHPRSTRTPERQLFPGELKSPLTALGHLCNVSRVLSLLTLPDWASTTQALTLMLWSRLWPSQQLLPPLSQSRDGTAGAAQAHKAGEPCQICRQGAAWNHQSSGAVTRLVTLCLQWL